jgi:microcystin degradation protein MlrC
MRVGITALLQESNTFVADRTRLEHFERDLLLTGEPIRGRLAAAHHEIGGFFEGLAEASIEAVPVLAARALPHGIIERACFDRLVLLLTEGLVRAGPLDGILAAPHGATVSEGEPDVDGAWLSRVRTHVGPGVPIVATVDPHGNLSRRMVDATDALVAYRTNPHVDQRERGREAALLMARTLRGEIRPTQSAAFPPMAINIECQATAEPPCLPLYRRAAAIGARPGVLSASLFLGFPYADVEEMGSSALVVTDDDPELAGRLALELAGEMWAARRDLIGHFIGIDEALDRARLAPPPVCLLDMGDNVGAGSPGDGTFLARAIHERRLRRAFVCLCDPAAVAAADRAGAGRTLLLKMGGATDDQHGAPLAATVEVLGLYDGDFDEPDARHGGLTRFEQGRTAVVRTPDDLTVLLTSSRVAPWSLGQLTSCGLDPAGFDLLVAKGVHAPVAAYRQVCRSFIRVDTPGVTTADMRRLTHLHRRRPMWPFEPEAEWPARPS